MPVHFEGRNSPRSFFTERGRIDAQTDREILMEGQKRNLISSIPEDIAVTIKMARGAKGRLHKQAAWIYSTPLLLSLISFVSNYSRNKYPLKTP